MKRKLVWGGAIAIATMIAITAYMGGTTNALNDPKTALPYYEQAVNANPEDTDAWLWLGALV
uniref:Uncharacterized protein n=1 Tax=Candidatus Kentrum sp. LPFa TaxID=2126335 RepID=A0A450X4J0_9GAMM|nr:MAG: hypothetical protein BECKLPF1236B_GA0070989_13942 [Candidatus Kentron sp. LPFa]